MTSAWNVFPPTVAVNGARNPDSALELSTREHQVLKFLAQGLLQKEIAQQLAISYHTVQSYTARIYEKLQVRSRSQAVAKYLGAIK